MEVLLVCQARLRQRASKRTHIRFHINSFENKSEGKEQNIFLVQLAHSFLSGDIETHGCVTSEKQSLATDH